MIFKNVVEQEGNNVFLFLDPPYYSATKSALYGKNGHLHKHFDHVRFAETMQQCKHHWLITYDDSDYMRELFSFATILTWDLTYGMRNVTAHSNQTGKELFISNYLIKLPERTLHERQLSLL
jgi:DNA adenine methylase